MRKIIVITGERGAGKSQFCQQLSEQKRKEGQTVGGFTAPAIYQAGRKTAFFTKSASTDKKRLCGEISEDSVRTIGHWKIDPEVLEWGNELLRKACPCDCLFIDELGPLEFEKKQGYQAAFDVLKNGEYQTAYVVIRPECLSAFQNIFPEFETVTIREGVCITGQKI